MVLPLWYQFPLGVAVTGPAFGVAGPAAVMPRTTRVTGSPMATYFGLVSPCIVSLSSW